MSSQSYRWQVACVTLAGAAAFGWGDAYALSLGRLTVQSALGEPLRAEIEVSNLSADDANSLRAQIANPDAFRSAGLEYSAVLSGTRVSLQRSINGRVFLHFTSTSPVNEPFVDLVLEVDWGAGKIVRDYTMLFDPPVLRPPAAPSPTLAVIPAAAPVAARPLPAPTPVLPTPPVAVASAPIAERASAPEASPAATPAIPPARAQQPATAPRPTVSRPATPTSAVPRPAAPERRVTVRAGDTAGMLASQHLPGGVTLDQMLVAMVRSNPEAFIAGNVHRVKAGAVLGLPSDADAEVVAPAEARRIVTAHSKDFAQYRRNLAANAPVTQTTGPRQQIQGKVQVTVKDDKPAAQSPDRLTLSKGSVQSKRPASQPTQPTAPSAEALARSRAASTAAQRASELQRNIADLHKLAQSVGTAAHPASKAVPASQGVGAKLALAVSAPTSTHGPAPTAAVSSTHPASHATPPVPAASTASAATVSPASQAADPPAPPSPPPSGLLDGLFSPNVLLGAGLAIVLGVIGAVAFFLRRKKQTMLADSSYMESRIPPESFHGVSGGQRIDTSEGSGTSSSLVYSPSQLDSSDDVDPVAEADVYLAYGRDLQAEEILKDALRTQPERVAVYKKLLEVYAKRKDAKSYESIATLAFNIVGGNSPDWTQICATGLILDPDNSLYRPGGQPAGEPDPMSDKTIVMAAFERTAPAAPSLPEAPPPDSDMDLDLDFSLDDMPAAKDAQPGMDATVRMEARSGPDTQPGVDPANNRGRMDALPPLPEPPPAMEEPPDDGSLPFHLEDTLIIPPSSTPEPPPTAAADSGMLEFDLSSLSLDIDEDQTPYSSPTAAPISGDPLETKLALAEEFRAIGDLDGARALIEEVLETATGDMRAKAERALKDI